MEVVSVCVMEPAVLRVVIVQSTYTNSHTDTNATPLTHKQMQLHAHKQMQLHADVSAYIIYIIIIYAHVLVIIWHIINTVLNEQ